MANSGAVAGSDFSSRRLERVFGECFYREFNTRLVGGAPEPLYCPGAGDGECHVIHYRDDHFASALHEVAHWCIAGPGRRLTKDFGYWYVPDGRNVAQQRAFERVEYRPQAMEWHFSRACGFTFRVSSDNLGCGDPALADTLEFRRRIVQQAMYWRRSGLPGRAGRFADALRAEFGIGSGHPPFTLAELS